MSAFTRAETLRSALRAVLTGEVDALPALFTQDVVGWSPNMLVGSIDELAEVVADRDGSLSDVNVEINAIDVVGDKGFMEYRITAVFSGPFIIGDDLVLEPNGRELLLGAVMVAEFDGDRIAVFRNYFDDAALLEQMLV